MSFSSVDAPVGLRNKSQNVTNSINDQQRILGLLATIPDAQGGKQESWASAMPLPGSKNGECPKVLADAILDFQIFWKKLGHVAIADGVVDPDKKTMKQLNALADFGHPADPTLRIKPEGQFDASACWAACYAWWLKAFPGQRPIAQLDILALGSTAHIVRSDGTVDLDGYLGFLNRRGGTLEGKFVSKSEIEGILAFTDLTNRPVIIGFKTGPASAHVNVIHGIDVRTAQVSVMECWAPDPTQDPNYKLETVDGQLVYESVLDGSPFKFVGQHLKRPLSYYTDHPLNRGKFLIYPWKDLLD